MASQPKGQDLRWVEAVPTGSGARMVEAGESIDSIAEETGHFWRTLWEHPDNAELKAARASRTVLIPGDRITVPDLRQKREERATDLVHRFKRKGVPAEIRFQVLDAEGVAQADRPYVLEVGKRRYEGRTDAAGKLHHFVTPGAAQALLSVRTDPDDDRVVRRWRLKIGRLQPIDTVEGLQSRLSNLGYACGTTDGVLGSRTQAALEQFLRTQSLSIENGYDDAARRALLEKHGS